MSIEVSGKQLAALVRGESIAVGPSKRVITLDDGPFVVERHHGPGPHPGTGTPQEVHGNGGASEYYRDSARDLFQHIPKTKRWDAVRDGLDAIDSVHEIDIWIALPLKETKSQKKGASYHITGGEPNRMMIKFQDEYGEGIETSIVHETGHHIDHWLLGQHEPYGVRWFSTAIAEVYGPDAKQLSESDIQDMKNGLFDYPVQNFEDIPEEGDFETMFLYPSDEISEASIYLWDAIVNTQSYKDLQNFKSTGVVEITPPDDFFMGERDNPDWVYANTPFKGNPVMLSAPPSLLRVMRRPREIFARAYAQYITQRSGNENMTRVLNESIDFQNAGGIPAQWQRNEFEPIATAFDELFRRKRWLKE